MSDEVTSIVVTEEAIALSVSTETPSINLSVVSEVATVQVTMAEQGPSGPRGSQGDKGDTGTQGIQGVKGDTGLQGIQGIQGLQGLQGEKGDTGYDMATFNATLDFGKGGMVATVGVTDVTITDSKIIQAFYTDHLDEVAVLAMRVNERTRTSGVGFELIGVAPNGAFGLYNVRVITQGT